MPRWLAVILFAGAIVPPARAANLTDPDDPGEIRGPPATRPPSTF
jgi:hypothetical protein